MKDSFLLIAASIGLLAGCSQMERDFADVNSRSDGDLVEKVIFEVLPIKDGDNLETRASAVPNGGTVGFIWEATDTVGIYPDKGSQVYFNIEDGVGTSSVSFTGGGWALKQNSTYTSYYPFVGDIYLKRDKIPVSFAGQKQIGTSSPFVGARYYLATGASTSENGVLRFSYNTLNTIINVNSTLPAGTYTKMSLTIEEPLFIEEGTYSLDDRVIVGTKFTNTLEIDLEDVVLTEEATIPIYIMSAPVDLNGKDVTIRFTAASGKRYKCIKTPTRAYSAGTRYGLTCDQMTSENSIIEGEDFLTFHVTKAGTIYWEGDPIPFTNPNQGPSGETNEIIAGENKSIYYSINDGEWNELTSYPTSSIDVSVGDVIRFYGNHYTYCFDTPPEIHTPLGGIDDLYLPGAHFGSDTEVRFSVSGSILSLLEGMERDYSFYAWPFYYLFAYCKGITDAHDLVLPTDLCGDHCYAYMFSGCTNLKSAPQLPAVNLVDHCYAYMFSGCTSLDSAPQLSATILADYCYEGMFSGCTSLDSAPQLPATTLADYCYEGMFSGCTSLDSAPVLPALTLVDGCYFKLFSGCSQLKRIECMAEENINVGALYYWTYGVSESGTFIKSKNVASWPIGVSGIPENWEFHSEVDSIHLNKTSISLTKGATETLIAVITPNGATNSIEWTSSNPTIATVDSLGIVHGVAAGSTMITASAGGKYATCAVTVIVPVIGVSLNKTSLSLIIGSSESLIATISPSDASNQNVTWSSSNTSIATVSNGVVTAKGEGTTIITATSVDGSFTATCTVNVSLFIREDFDPDKYLLYRANHTGRSSGDNYYVTESYMPGISGSKVEMKFQFAGPGPISTGNTARDYYDFMSIDSSSLIWNETITEDGEREDDRLSYPIPSATSLLLIMFNGLDQSMTINGIKYGCSRSSMSWSHLFADYYRESDEGIFEAYEGIPDGSKLFYVKTWDASNTLTYVGYATTSVNPSTNRTEYCWCSYYPLTGSVSYTFAHDSANQGGFEGFTP